MRSVLLVIVAMSFCGACADDGVEMGTDAAWVVPDDLNPQKACTDLLTAAQAMAARCDQATPTWTCEGVLGIGNYHYLYGYCIPSTQVACETASLPEPCLHHLLHLGE